MRALIACIALAACATTSDLAPPERVAGCWINREAGAARMRWSETANSAGAFLGSRTVFGIAGANTEHYALETADEGWRLCRIEAGEASHCWAVAQGEGGPLAGGRTFIDRSGDTLRIAVIGDGPERVIFEGRREACGN